MKMARKMIKGGALAAACLLLFLTAVPREAQGAVAIDTDEDCSMTFSLGKDYEDTTINYGELGTEATGPVSVQVYRVAEVTPSGQYETLDAYDDLTLGPDVVNAATTAETWEELAQTAKDITEKEGLQPDKTADVIRRGTIQITELPTGMYLVLVADARSEEYLYSFKPALVALPMNYYSASNPDDSWVYDVTVNLKAECTERLADLRIVKNLASYNGKPGDEASFIFQVEAVKNRDGVPTKVYSGVVEYRFTGPGSRNDLVIEDLPAGSQVTVTEVYSGAGYRLSEGSSRTYTIDWLEADTTAEVSFRNEYDGGMNGGTSVVNHFGPKLPETETVESNGEEGINPLSDESVDPDSIVWTWTQE